MNTVNIVPDPITSKVKAQIQLVTLEMARQWLGKRHPRQMARYSEKVAQGYANQMRNGSWDPEHPQGIIISSDGYLLDGQHRLEALLIFGCALEMLVVQGVNKETYCHIDAGYGRTLAFRANRPKDDMAIYTAVLQLALHGLPKLRPTVEQIDTVADFLAKDLAQFYNSTSKTRKARLNPAHLRTAVVLRIKEQPEASESICDAYNCYLLGDFHNAPRSMSALYRRMTEEYNPALNIFGLSWKAFDPRRFDQMQIKLISVSDDIKAIQKSILAPLIVALRS